ncbi:hypothetical protein J8N05_14625 [Streptomyces sp. BH-SS-21]|uniref:Peptidase S1 domain-containing protein n=1 Tax=Streptomyces liliiviolaceus TaxID=2823109 RepID=A0A940XRZ1_9ACTN|nr:trypsin-like serine protease [Streptomyces liliiviolaceus]MBQ0849437.1 hypothetical protein [Streptomyces liliiviolaceus]
MKRTGVVLGALALAATGWAGSAEAVTPAPSAAADDTQVSSFSASEQDAALKFWTPERLATAQEMTVDGARTSGPADAPVRSGPDASVLPTAATGEDAEEGDVSATAVTRPRAWTEGGLIRKTTGKVFFEADAGTFTCSATVANSANGSVVLTAGHCVVDGRTGEVYRNWVFIPAYKNGNRPYGTFTANKLFHTKRYVTSRANANWDFGFARLSKHNGRTVKRIVGAQGIKFNHANGQKVHSFGYGGSAAEGSGERLNHCTGKEHRDTGRPDSTMWGIDCVQTGGSSGGGFLADFRPATGKGVLIGNISVGAGDSEYHPYLGKVARTVYRKAGGA